LEKKGRGSPLPYSNRKKMRFVPAGRRQEGGGKKGKGQFLYCEFQAREEKKTGRKSTVIFGKEKKKRKSVKLGIRGGERRKKKSEKSQKKTRPERKEEKEKPVLATERQGKGRNHEEGKKRKIAPRSGRGKKKPGEFH